MGCVDSMLELGAGTWTLERAVEVATSCDCEVHWPWCCWWADWAGAAHYQDYHVWMCNHITGVAILRTDGRCAGKDARRRNDEWWEKQA